MTLSTGTRLGPYEILAPLGAGGMGEVYRARDTRLERTVAVKVLHTHMAASAELRQRFEREAKTISQLSHPHICALYDVGTEGEIEYLVMELLEGETLSDRLAKGPLPREQMLRYGTEIADALDQAHRHGIVHRDLKPSNVMITKSGVKLLDFGLAKAVAPLSTQSSLTGLPTQQGLTEEGTILGTFQYMAPEQLEGKDADARTDLFAFGAVLYEMATGRKAFSASSRASLIAAIMSAEPPPISSIQQMSPPALDRIVKTCLAKDPDDRWQSASDVAKELRWVSEAPSGVAGPESPAARRKNREWIAWSVAAAAVVSVVALAVANVRISRREPPRTWSFLLPPDKAAFDMRDNSCGSLTVSPDGSRITFGAKTADGQAMIWLRSIGEPTAHPIAGTEGASFPFWSPDSRYLAFFAGGKLQKVDLAGTPPLAICDAANGRSGSWSRGGVILFSPDANSEIFQVAASGGAARPATTLDVANGETTHRWAIFLPDGKKFLYLAGSHDEGAKSERNAVYLTSLGSTQRTHVLQGDSNVAYASGYLFSMRKQILLAQRFDPTRGRLTGDPVRVADGVNYDAGYFRGNFSVSDTGVLLYATGGGEATTRLQWFDTATFTALGGAFGDPAEYTTLAAAPDGSHIAAGIADPVTGLVEIWLIDAHGARTRFTFGAPASSPVYSPDGNRIAYAKKEKNSQRWGIYVKPTSGGGQEQAIYQSDAQVTPVDWSRDGRFISLEYLKPGSKTKEDIWILPLSGDHKAFPFAATEFAEADARFSPDGRWMTYTSDESGRRELYAVSFPNGGQKWEISPAGTLGGTWLSGDRVAYGSLDGSAVAVEVKATPQGLEIGPPKTFPLPSISTNPAFAPDGQRVVLAVRVENAEASHVALVTNWMAGLPKD
jgi:serine/threonine protein kinase/Tol biopolymer transport system component